MLLPGTAFVELAVRAAAAAGADGVDELTLQAPLVLPESGVVQLQCRSGPRTSTAGGRWRCTPGRPAGRARSGRGTPPGCSVRRRPAGRGASWPPAGASRSTSRRTSGWPTAGYGYGPAFRGLVAAWAAANGSDRYVEVRLPAGLPADGYAVHPALLDAALHVLVLDARTPARGCAAVRLVRGAAGRPRYGRAAGPAEPVGRRRGRAGGRGRRGRARSAGWPR